jgi:hypothetical protein
VLTTGTVCFLTAFNLFARSAEDLFLQHFFAQIPPMRIFRPLSRYTRRQMRKSFGILALALLISIPIFWIFNREGRRRIDPPSVLAQVQRLNQLATVKYTIQKVIGLSEQKQPVGSESILLIVQATVQAGIDLASLRPDDVMVRPDGTVVVRLPAPTILSVSIDEKETKVWDRQKTWWTPWVSYSLDLEQRARVAGLQAVYQAALDMGILPQAERNAETSIRGLLGIAGIKAVQVLSAKAPD